MNEQPRNMERLAKALAVVAHDGQYRVNGEEYIEHVLRVARSFSPGSLQRQIAYLHDTIEDCGFTQLKLTNLGFSAKVTDAVAHLTRYADTGTYQQYIDNLVRNGSDEALAVKLADLHDNQRDLPDSLASQMGRYMHAEATIREEVWRRGRQAQAAAAANKTTGGTA